ncbi:MAG: GGDEF domain-containing protein [gamma proteobacterium symbiont of Taylorina sp.]|nr:GGDEF domain-containing protein [gamma proteobacterium symbiont of Taylorina sp.]
MMTKIIDLLSELMGITTPEQWGELLSSKEHSLPIKNHRASILAKRICIFAWLFAILVPAWSLIDYLLLPYELWFQLAILRFISGFVFLGIAIACNKRSCPLNKIFISLTLLLYVPTFFYLIANPILADTHFAGLAGALVNIYSLLPFLVIAALTVFALTITELLIITLPLIVITIWSLYPESSADISNSFMFIWLFLLLIGTSFFSSISQMRYMISQVTRASFDTLTQAMTRRAGIESLELYTRMAQLQNNHLSLLFIDLDHFKSLNDDYGHDAGDNALKGAVAALKNYIRKGDSVIRWGGEEFLILLPHADQGDARRVISRIFEQGLGQRPEGKLLTASMGLSELIDDNIDSWKALVELADQRMYHAKESGRARCVGSDMQILGQAEPET